MNMDRMLIFAGLVLIGIFAILFLLSRSNTIPDQNVPASPTSALILQPSNPAETSLSTTPIASPASIVKDATSATIKTTKGDITIELYPQDAPKTVANFATLASTGYYDNLTFHRVEDWVIQGGDPTGTGAGGTSIFGQKFEDELNPNTDSYKEGYKEGVVAMANSGPNTNGSQFFILTKDTPLDNAYTIFGKVTSGMDVVKQIQKGDKMVSITAE